MSSNILCNQLTVRDTLKNVTLDNVTITSLQLDSASATDGYVLTSDGSGNATWEALPVGGAPTFGNGTEALPSITFASDTGTGIYRPSAGTMGLVSAGSSVATVSASGITVAGGKVSSGTLQVVDDAVTGYVLTSGDNNGNATWSGQILLPDGTFANPSYGFVDHAGCGMFCDSNTKLSLTVANDPMLEITDGGIGVGGDGIFSGTVDCGLVTVADGTSGAPTYSFADHTANGMYCPSDTTLTLTVNGEDTVEVYDTGVAISGDAEVSGKTVTTTFQMTDGATNGYVLTSDASGNASWAAASGGAALNLDFGDNNGTATVSASVDGSLAHGDAQSTSSILASGLGSHAHGATTISSTVTASGKGSHAQGSTTSTSIMLASGEGSRVQGIAYNGGRVEASSFSSDACGSADGANSKVLATFHTACARGQAMGGGEIRAGARAAFSFGRALASGTTVYADGANSVVFAQATGTSSTVSATGENAFIVGRNSFASASMSATGVASSIIGVVDTAGNMLNAADASLSVGRSTTLSAANDYSILLGQYGTSLTTADTLPIGTNTGCLQIAGGTSGSPDISVVIGTDTPGTGSTGKGYANAWETSGADYAEFFEWEDGNVDEQDRIGYFVKLTGDGKIVKANAVDALASNVLGIVTSTQSHTAFIADGHAMKWCGIAMRDEFGRILTELNYKQPTLEVLYAHYRSLGDPDDAPQVPPQELIDSIESKEETDATIVDLLDESLRDQVAPIRQIRANPDYNRDATYIRRNDRPEWDPISLLGKVYVRDDGTCVVGQKCTCNADGIATPGADWFVMERKSANVIRVFFK